MGRFHKMLAVTKRVWVTLALVSLVAVAGLTTRVAAGSHLSEAQLSRLGFAPADTFGWSIGRLFSSAVVTSGGSAFWTALFAVVVLSGLIEWQSGHVAATVAFWGSHALTIAIGGLALAAVARLDRTLAHVLYSSRDVGPSAGYVGCLGWLIASQKREWRLPLASAAILATGMLMLGTAPEWRGDPLELSAAIAHFIAIPVGFWLGFMWVRYVSPSTRDVA